MADDRQRARRRAGASREEVQLQQSGPRPKTNLAVGVEEVQVVARDPVPAEDQVGAHVHVHRGRRQRLAERVTEAEVNQHWCSESQCLPRRRGRDQRGAGLA